MASAGGYTQDLPPQGGYGPVDWAKRIPKRLNGYMVFGGFIAFTTASWAIFIHRRRIENFIPAALWEVVQWKMCNSLVFISNAVAAPLDYCNYDGDEDKKRHDLEVSDARIAVYPLYEAERHRMLLRLHRQNRDEERELMKNVPGWELGTFYGEPVFFNMRDRFYHPILEELYAHSKWYDMYTKAFEKLEH